MPPAIRFPFDSLLRHTLIQVFAGLLFGAEDSIPPFRILLRIRFGFGTFLGRRNREEEQKQHVYLSFPSIPNPETFSFLKALT